MPIPPLPLRLVLRPPVGPAQLAQWARRWSVDSQQVSRRNAMLAATALTARRREREEVEDLLGDRAAERAVDQAPPAPAVRRSGGG